LGIQMGQEHGSLQYLYRTAFNVGRSNK